MATDDSRGSSCSLPPPAQDSAQDCESKDVSTLELAPESTDHPYCKTGTIDQHGTEHPKLKQLYRHVKKLIAVKWFDVGVELFEEDDLKQLSTIKSSNNGNVESCCAEMLKLWHEKYPKATWNDLIESLNAPGVELNDTASRIEGMLLSPDLPAFDSAKYENEATNAYVAITSDVVGKEEKLVMGSYEQQISKDPLQDSQTQSKHPHYLLSSQQHVNNTSSVARAVDNTGYNDRPKRMALKDDSNISFHSDTPGTSAITLPNAEDTKHYREQIHMNDITTLAIMRSDSRNRSARVCEAVSEFYRGQFVDKWKSRTDYSTINNLAALLFERNNEMKVVVFTAGTTKKRECSYSINNGSVDECMWGHCDGHAVSVCYRFSSFYLITEMYRYKKDRQTSILEAEPGGYQLKKGIKLHFFTTNVPCGFIANKEDHYLSWKTPFREKPHCLKCSSVILISAYLGIQGPLSHFFKKPVYISSITIPKCENIGALKCAEIIKSFEDFDVLLQGTDEIPENNYNFHIPHVEMAEIKPRELFSECFASYSRSFSYSDASQTTESLTEVRQAAGVVPDADGNLGSHMIVSTLKHGIGTDGDEFREKMKLQLQHATNDFPNDIKLSRYKLLVQAQKRLSLALDTGKALEKLKNFISKEIDKRFTAHCQSAKTVIAQLKEMEQCRSITDEITVQVNKLQESLCTIVKRIEDDCNIQAVKEPLPCLREKFETDSRLVMEHLDSLNISMKEFDNDTKSKIEGLTDYHAYKETLDDLNSLLEKNKSNNCDPQFCLDLMGCDWARSMGAIHKDIPGDHSAVYQPSVAQQQQQVSSEKNENHILGTTDRNIVQEPQNETAAEVDPQTEMEKPVDGGLPPCDVTSSYDLVHQTSWLPSLPEEQESQKQQYNLGNSDCIKESENEAQEESQTGITKPNERVMSCVVAGGYGIVPPVCRLSSSEQQHQGSKLVFGNSVERRMIEKPHPQNHTAIQEEVQHGGIFGCDLAELVRAEGGNVPKFLIRCMEEIEKRGLMVTNIYHLPGNAEQIEKLQHRIDQGIPVDFAGQEWEDISIIAGGLKRFLKELPNTLIPIKLHNRLTNAGKIKPPHKVAKLKSCISELPEANYQTLKMFLDHLRKVTKYSSVNKMHCVNLATIFGPLIPIHSKVMEAFLTDYDAIFG